MPDAPPPYGTYRVETAPEGLRSTWAWPGGEPPAPRQAEARAVVRSWAQELESADIPRTQRDATFIAIEVTLAGGDPARVGEFRMIAAPAPPSWPRAELAALLAFARSDA